MEYKIEIIETLSHTETIEAGSLDEAMDIVKEKYHNEEIVLNENNYVDTEFIDIEPIIERKSRYVR